MTTGGTIELATEGVTLGGSISGAVINLSAGTLEAERLHDVEINASGSALINSTITGTSTVRADGYKLSQAISLGEGSQLTLQGSVDLSQLELDMTSSGIQTLDGKLIEGAEGISGFAVDLSYSCTVVDVGAAASVTTQSPLHLSHSALMNGRELVLGADGIAVSSGNGVDYSTFFLYEDGIEYSAAQIAQVSAAQGGSLSGISMDGGVLNVDANARVFADIGCYTLGALPPFRAIDTCLDMGASITMAKGAADAGVFPAIAVIGDSTFTHSGMTGLLDAVNDKAQITVVISDNLTTAMTGGQDSAGTNKFEAICLGLGVEPEHVRVVVPLPKNMEEITRILREEIEYKGVSVIIPRRECIQTLNRKLKQKKAEKKS